VAALIEDVASEQRCDLTGHVDARNAGRLGDLRVGTALHDERHQVPLSAGQVGEGCAAGEETADHRRALVRIYQRPGGADLPDRGTHLEAGRKFDQVADRAVQGGPRSVPRRRPPR